MTEQKYAHGANRIVSKIESRLERIARIVDVGLVNSENSQLISQIYFVGQRIKDLKEIDQNAFVSMYYKFREMKVQHSEVRHFDIVDETYSLTKLFNYVLEKEVR